MTYLTFLQRGVDDEMEAAAAKTAFLTLSALAFVMFSYYTSDLTAQMTYRPPPVQLHDFQVRSVSQMIEEN